MKVNRPTKPPFDIQHRTITFYSQDSPSDFKGLSEEITVKLKAQLKKTEAMQTIASLSPVKDTEGLSPYEIAAMVSIIENRLNPDDEVTPHQIRNDMQKAGFTNIAASLSLESLKRKGMTDFDHGQDYSGNSYPTVILTSKGMDWILESQSVFKLSILDDIPNEEPQISDDDIPF